MSSWFSGGLSQNLSQFTGQLSNFTKEVLTEGTEEVDDHATQLKIAQAQITELESICAAQRAEVERLKVINEESAEKLESAELQINAVSNEYRAIIHQKEAEIKNLQHSELDLLEKLSQTKQRSNITAGLVQDDEEGLFSHTEFCDAGMHRSFSQPSFTGKKAGVHSEGLQVDSAKLQDQIQVLETELRSSRDSHQAELVALQDAHSQKIGLLKKRHKEEVRSLKEQIQTLEHGDGASNLQSGNEEGATGGYLMVGKRTGNLEKDLQLQRENFLKSEELNSELRKKNEVLRRKLEDVQKDLAGKVTPGEQKSTSDAQHTGSHIPEVGSNKSTESAVGEMQLKLEDLETQLADMTQERDSLVESLEELDRQNQEALQQILQDRNTLKLSNKSLQAKIDELEISQSSGVTKVESLEVKLRELESKHETDADLVKSLEFKIGELESKLKKDESPLQGVPDESSDVPKQLQGVSQEMSALYERIQVLEEEVTNLEDTNVKLEAELNDAQERLENAQTSKKIDSKIPEEFLQLRDQLEEVSTENRHLQGSVTKATTENRQLQEMITSIEGERKEVEARMRRCESEVVEKQTALDCVSHELSENEAAKEKFVEGYARLESEVGTLIEKSNQSAEEILRLQESCRTYELQLDTKDKEVKALKSKSEEECEKSALLVQEKDGLIKQVKNLEEGKEELIGHIDELQQSLLDSKHEQLERFQSERTDLTTKIDSLTTQRESLERELASTEQKLRGQIKQQESYISELTRSRDLDTAGLEGEHERLMKACREKDTEIRDLRSELEQKQSDLDYTKDMLQSTMDSQRSISDLLGEKDKEISCLKTENNSLSELNENSGDVIKKHEAELKRLQPIESQYNNLTQEHRKLKTEIDKFKTRIKELETKEETYKVESATLDIITDLESEITNLRDKVETLDKTCTEQTLKISSLTQQVDDLESEIDMHVKDKHSLHEMLTLQTQNMKEADSNMSELSAAIELKNESLENHENNMKKLKNENENLKSELTKAQTIIQTHKQDLQENTECKESKMIIPTSNDVTHTGAQNGDSLHRSAEFWNGDYGVVEIENMHRMVAQQSSELSALKEKNEELSAMLQARSGGAALGSAALADVHKLEGEMRSLRLEKEQMMQVLNDKSRECSQLKGEVHKLMSVVSAEKSALCKLQQDNQELRTRQAGEEAARRQGDGDMQREAVRNLSRIIRDKELEIESLNMKNQTLLQVLQDSSGEGVQISSLMQERDNLLKQVALFQNDREQIVNALSAKHQECLLYHGEIQRLTALLQNDSGKSEDLRQQYEALVAQYEDKQKCLLAAREELVSLRNEMAALKGELADVRFKCAEADGKVRKLTMEKDGLQERCDQLLERVETQQTKIVDRQMLKMANQDANAVPSENAQLNGSSPDLNGRTDLHSSPVETQSQNGGATQLPIVCDHESELASLRLLVHSHEQTLADKDIALSQKDSEAVQLYNQLSERDKTLDEKDKELSELSSRFHKTEQMLRTRDTEINSIRKQNDQLSFKLKGYETELSDIRVERDQYQSKSGTLEQQIDMVKEANNKLSMALKDHAFELNALKEKNNTLTRLLQEKSSEGEEKGEMDRLMKETETLQHQAKAFKVDADQFAMALQQQQEENRELKAQLVRVSEKEAKFSREVDRLRTHLVQVEDGYTRELLEAEEREKDIRNRLAGAEERALTASSSVDRANTHAGRQIEALQLQLSAVVEQRDKVTVQLAAAQEQASQYAAESNNLHIVLEQFQQEKEQQQAAEVEMYLREVSTLRQENQLVSQQLQDVQMQLNETTEALEAASRLSEQLDKKEEMVSALREEVQVREQQLKQAEAQIAKLSASNSAKVDKALARNLILGYFHTPSSKKQEVIDIIGRALDFEGDELRQLKGEAAGGWLSGLFKKVVATQTPPTTPAKSDPAFNKSFSEALVKFMEKESTPEAAFKLPAEQMALESQQRHGHHKAPHGSAFNPFSTPVSDLRMSSQGTSPRAGGAFHPLTVSVPGDGGRERQGGGGGQSEHLLMAPMSPRLPMFSASLMAGSNEATRGTSSQHESLPVTSTGVMTVPQSTSAILKDVLQQ